MGRTQMLPLHATEFDYWQWFTSSLDLSKFYSLSLICLLCKMGIIKYIFQGMLLVLTEVICIKRLAQRWMKLNSSVCVTVIRGSLMASRRGVIRSSEEVKFQLGFEEWRGFQDTKMEVEGAFQVHWQDGSRNSQWFSLILA